MNYGISLKDFEEECFNNATYEYKTFSIYPYTVILKRINSDNILSLNSNKNHFFLKLLEKIQIKL